MALCEHKHSGRLASKPPHAAESLFLSLRLPSPPTPSAFTPAHTRNNLPAGGTRPGSQTARKSRFGTFLKPKRVFRKS